MVKALSELPWEFLGMDKNKGEDEKEEANAKDKAEEEGGSLTDSDIHSNLESDRA